MNKIDVIGDADEVLDWHLDELCVTALMIAITEHLVQRAFVVTARQARGAPATADAGLQHDALPGLHDFAGHVAAWCVGRGLGWQSDIGR